MYLNKQFKAAFVYIFLFLQSGFSFAGAKFEWDDFENRQGLRVTITTERLVLRSVVEDDIPDLVRLYADADVMRKFGAGTPKDEETTIKRVKDTWIPRWRDNDPRSAFVVYLKEDPKVIVGNVVLGVGEGPGRSELAYLFFKEFWGKGLASEALGALVHEYATALIERKYNFAKGFKDCSAMILTRIDATASPDNIASYKILDKLGFTCARPELQVLGEGGSPPESGSYNIKSFETVLDKLSGEEETIERIRTAEKKYGMMKWHFMRPIGSQGTCDSSAAQSHVIMP
jgi:ribosomal-protein-alanine N-acetyltransferase